MSQSNTGILLINVSYWYKTFSGSVWVQVQSAMDVGLHPQGRLWSQWPKALSRGTQDHALKRMSPRQPAKRMDLEQKWLQAALSAVGRQNLSLKVRRSVGLVQILRKTVTKSVSRALNRGCNLDTTLRALTTSRGKQGQGDFCQQKRLMSAS
jgi:hypothetical protein